MSADCSRPLSDEALLAWWTGELVADEHDALEEHVFACAACARQASRLGAIAQGVQALVRRGELPAVLLPAVVDRLRAEGRRIREYRVEPGGAVDCTVRADDDVVLSSLGADLAGVTRLDLVIRIDDGPEERLSELPFDPASHTVVLAPSADWLRSLPTHVQHLRLLAVEPRGERALGEYTFNHTAGADRS